MQPLARETQSVLCVLQPNFIMVSHTTILISTQTVGTLSSCWTKYNFAWNWITFQVSGNQHDEIIINYGYFIGVALPLHRAPPTVGLWLPYKAYMITYQNDSHTVIAKSLAIQWNYWPGLGYSYMVCCGKQESFSTGNSEHGNVMTINHHHNSDGLLSISSNGE